MAGELIPSIDVSSLNGSQAERMRCAKAIGRACEEVGFFHIVGHGVDSGQRVRVFDVSKQFFALPLTTKMDVALSAESGFRGYFPFKGEVTDPLIGGDPKEGYDISFAPDDNAHGRGNRWPEEPSDLRAVMPEYYLA
jgi:isopenicillin N synthase-like dioxygenase